MLGEQVYKHLLSGPELGGNRGNYILEYPRKLRIKDRRAQKKRVLMTRAPRASMRRTQMGQPLMRRAPIQSPNGKDLVGKDRNGKGPKRKETRRFWLREQRRGGGGGQSLVSLELRIFQLRPCIVHTELRQSRLTYAIQTTISLLPMEYFSPCKNFSSSSKLPDNPYANTLAISLLLVLGAPPVGRRVFRCTRYLQWESIKLITYILPYGRKNYAFSNIISKSIT